MKSIQEVPLYEALNVSYDFESYVDERLDKEKLASVLDRTLSTLEKRQTLVVKMYFGIDQKQPATLEEIGKNIGVSREQIRRIKRKAIRRLQHSSRSRELREFMF